MTKAKRSLYHNNHSAAVIQFREQVGFFFLKDAIVTLFLPQTPRNTQSFVCSSSDNNKKEKEATSTELGVKCSHNDIKTEDSNNHHNCCQQQSSSCSSSSFTNEVKMESSSSSDTTTTTLYPPTKTWMDVHVLSLSKMNEKEEESKVVKSASSLVPSTPPPNNYDDNDSLKRVSKEEQNLVIQKCARCNLVLHYSTNNNGIELYDEEVPNFTGCLQDMFACTIHNCNEKKGKRSDASLLLGTVMNCHSLNYLRIEQFQIAFIANTGVVVDKNCIQVKASIVITVSLPYLEQISLRNSEQYQQEDKVEDYETTERQLRRSRRKLQKQQPLKTTTTATTTTTRKRVWSKCWEDEDDDDKVYTKRLVLPSFVQLLFTLLRCDWKQLEYEMKMSASVISSLRDTQEKEGIVENYHDNKKNETELMKKQQQQQQVTTRRKETIEKSLFPSVLSLEQLYSRIQGANNNDYHHEDAMDQSISTSNITETTVLNIPEVILQHTITSYYLTAKSLHALRCTCRFFHKTLRAVVPGMKLRLFQHQMKSLDWMRKREGIALTEGDAIVSSEDSLLIKKNKRSDGLLHGDLYRAVSTGSIVTVVPRRVVTSANATATAVPWFVNVRTGSASRIFHNGNNNNNTNNDDESIEMKVARTKYCARGGLLCDDPGLGKTITVLSLILQTFGQTTQRTSTTTAATSTTSTESEKECNKEQPKLNFDSIFEAYWKEGTTKELRIADLHRLIRQHQCIDKFGVFDRPVETLLKEKPNELKEYEQMVENPICFMDIMTKVQDDCYKNDFHLFCKDVSLCFSNAILYNEEDSPVYKIAKSIGQASKEIIHEFKQRELAEAQRIFNRRSDRSEATASYGSLLRLKSKEELLDTLHPSRATLLVVPNTLVQHWEDQIKMHVDFTFCTNKIPLLYRHGGTNKKIRGSKFLEVNNVDSAKHFCNRNLSHCPLIFIDESVKEPLPKPEFLAMFYIVITNSQRLTSEWKHGSAEEELQRGKRHWGRTKRPIRFKHYNYNIGGDMESSPCPLLKVYWLRLIVDEGHSMGRGNHLNSIQFASWITAQRRWAMTGTPTPQTVSKNGVKNLLGLMKFLKHEDFNVENGGYEKLKALGDSFGEGNLSVFFQLKSLLNLYMVRHTKDNIEELPKPHFSRTYTSMSTAETLAYNTLVSAVQMNLVPTSMKSKTSGFQDSLLNPRQAKHAHRALSNIQLAGCGGTKVAPTLTEKNWEETLSYMKNKHNADEVQQTRVNNFLQRMTTEQLSSCMVCGLQLQTLFLLPCACQICTECITSETSSCPACKKEFNADDFQLLQPGLDYTWRWNVELAQKVREANARLQLALARLEGLPTNNNPFNNQIQVPLINRDLQRRRRRRSNEPHQCVFPEVYTDGKCSICGEIHMCNFLTGGSQCSVCHCVSENCPKDESKAYYVINKILRLYHTYRGKDHPLKVIIFSQFRQILNVVGDRLIRSLGTGCIAEYWGLTRNKELERFSKPSDCFCMLLGKDGSHGLDLSFVTHIFFLDEILDKSLESQVVARAYRMGAKQSVQVEQLVSRHSIEELIVQMNSKTSIKDLYENSNEREETDRNSPNGSPPNKRRKIARTLEFVEKTQQHKRVHFLLSNVKLIRTGQVKVARKNGMLKDGIVKSGIKCGIKSGKVSFQI